LSTFTLETALDVLTFDRNSGRLVSMAPKYAPGTELIASRPDDPAFVLQYLDENREYRQVSSRSAAAVRLTEGPSGDGRELRMEFERLGGLELNVTVSVLASASDSASRWRCRLSNGAGLRVVDIQYPFIVASCAEEAALLQPAGFGELIEGPALESLRSDEPRRWQLIPENGNSPHYPGRSFAQFLALCGPQAGVYMACEDTEGNVKLLQGLRREAGLRLGVAHVGDWPVAGERQLEYPVVVRSFSGDWYDAADIYRDWSLQQKWATSLSQRADVPQWLLESPPHITIRLQGYVDAGPAPAIEQFLPYEKCIPLLEGIAQGLDSPLVAVLMSWERGGPWVYPDCFPPVGGDESMARFTQMARQRGWHVGSFCNGTRWVMKHLFNGYDGAEYFEQRDGAQSVCVKHDGELWGEGWDASWRPSYICCMAQQLTRDIAVEFVDRLIGWGMESIQYFDQNCSAATFPCFSDQHGHPPIPGKWMAEAMERMIADFRRLAEDAGEAGVIQSTENPCNEYCLQLFQQCDVRVSPPSCGVGSFVPVYHYLFHECQIMHGMMSTGPEPFSIPVRTAWNGVLGEVAGAVMAGDGSLINRETFNWESWEPKVGSQQDALAMIRAVTGMRKGPGREFLVYGRMQRPATVEGVETLQWEHGGRQHAVPAVAHAAWQAPDGRHGVVLANWTTQERIVRVRDERLKGAPSIHICASGAVTESTAGKADGAQVTLPALSFGLVTQGASGPGHDA